MDKEIEKLFEGVSKEILSEDVQKKLGTLIETKINEKANVKEQELQENYDVKKAEMVEKLEEATVEYVDEYLIEKIDNFLDKISDVWLNEHTVEVEDGIKAEMFDKIVSGMKNVLKESQIKEDDIETQTDIKEAKDKLEADYNSIFEENKELEDELQAVKSNVVFNEKTVKLTESEKEKVKTLCEDFDIDDLEEFGSKVQTIVENVSKFEDKKEDSDEEETDELTENVNIDGEDLIKKEDTSDIDEKFGIDYL